MQGGKKAASTSASDRRKHGMASRELPGHQWSLLCVGYGSNAPGSTCVRWCSDARDFDTLPTALGLATPNGFSPFGSMTYRIPLLLLAAILATPNIVLAQRRATSATSGLNLGVAVQTARGDFDDNVFSNGETDPGGGIDLHVGYNFSPRFGLLVVGSGADVDGTDGNSFTLGQAELVGRYIFSNNASRFIPYIEAGGGWVFALADNDAGVERELAGPVLVAGVGLDFFLMRRLALEGAFKFSRGELDSERIGNTTVTQENGIAVSTGRLKLGFAWYPMARR